ncbi:hypothetical protein [Bradyrhizobium stylosanthis]|uniref:Uncharacterized protein n=1 Tax=Bradyrhizobium stylosanthis TaxID=1803665 RepID=A0A560DKC7_9BRAD|nr:hypothetical protein [Bradyrhizobium stylosanthis]TWA97532.1 hypothetical protein FBZ96_106591 [Bradyrhizobium stylosanthis]
MSDQELRNENLIEVLKRNGDFSKNYGPWLGALLLWLAMKSARPRSFWWGGLIGLATVVGGLVLKFGLPTFTG